MVLLNFYLNNNQPENEVLPMSPLKIGPRVARWVLMKIWSPTSTSDITNVLLQWKPDPETVPSSKVDPRALPFRVISRHAHGISGPLITHTEI